MAAKRQVVPLARAARPPFRPAALASAGVKRWAVPLTWAALPPLLAIARRFSGSIAAKPRILLLVMIGSCSDCPATSYKHSSIGWCLSSVPRIQRVSLKGGTAPAAGYAVTILACQEPSCRHRSRGCRRGGKNGQVPCNPFADGRGPGCPEADRGLSSGPGSALDCFWNRQGRVKPEPGGKTQQTPPRAANCRASATDVHSGSGLPTVSGKKGSTQRPRRNTRHIVTPA